MEEILLGTGIGILLGTISGIIPGVHANTLAGVLLSFQVVLLSLFGPLVLAGAMFAALITHTFVDSVPSTFLGIPDADTSLAVLPAHALCLEGNGEEAVRIAALGSACAIVMAVPLSVICFFLLPALQPFFDWWIGILLIASVGYMIVTSECPGWGLALFLVIRCSWDLFTPLRFPELAYSCRRQCDSYATSHRTFWDFGPYHRFTGHITGTAFQRDKNGRADYYEMFASWYHCRSCCRVASGTLHRICKRRARIAYRI